MISFYPSKVQQERKEAVRKAAMDLGEVEDKLADIVDNKRSTMCRKAANPMLELCRQNRGVHIKVGQHLAQLDYLIPPEHIDALSFFLIMHQCLLIRKYVTLCAKNWDHILKKYLIHFRKIQLHLLL